MSYCFISSLPGPFTSLEMSKRNLTKILSLFCRSKIYQLCLWKFYYSNIVVLAWSQTVYFLFKVRLARVIKYKPRGFIDRQRKGVVWGSPMFLKRTKRKIKQCLCTGYC